MTDEEWNNDFARCLGVYLAGEALEEVDDARTRGRDDNFLLLFNAHHEAIPFTLPDFGAGGWLALVDTALDNGLLPEGTYQPRGAYDLAGRARSALLQQVRVRHEACAIRCRSGPSCGDGTRFRLWAPAARARGCRAGRGRTARSPSCRMARDSDGWFELIRRGRRRRRPLCVSHRRRINRFPIRHRAAIPTTCTRRAWSSIPGAYDWQRRELARPAVGGGGDLRVARRYVHAGGDVRRRARAPRLSAPARHHRDRADAAWRSFPGGATGATTACCRSRRSRVTARRRT